MGLPLRLPDADALEALRIDAALQDALALETVGPQHDSLWKTKLCKFHLRNRCSRGELCKYAHGVDELNPLPNLYKTRLCYSYVRMGSCLDAECRHAHGIEELRPGGPHHRLSISEPAAQRAAPAAPGAGARALERAAAAERLWPVTAEPRGRGLQPSLPAAGARGRPLEAPQLQAPQRQAAPLALAPAPPPRTAAPGAVAAPLHGRSEEGAGLGGLPGRWRVSTYQGLPGLHGVVPL